MEIKKIDDEKVEVTTVIKQQFTKEQLERDRDMFQGDIARAKTEIEKLDQLLNVLK